MSTLTFITCGSVDDGKSTLIGRLLVDSKAVMSDQLAAVSRSGAADLALLTDGLSAEREQGITIDVAWRYFATPARKFIIGDAPGHEQYTRNMVTAASKAQAALVLVDATKLSWAGASSFVALEPAKSTLLPQTRRHALLCHLLRVPNIVFVVNKLDALGNPDVAFERIDGALRHFARQAGIAVAGVVPISALFGDNVSRRTELIADYSGPSLLELLEQLPSGAATDRSATQDLAITVQWVEKSESASATTHEGRRIFWGQLAAGSVQAGASITLPTGQTAQVARLLSTVRAPIEACSELGASVGLVLEGEYDVSRGDWLLSPQTRAAGELKTIDATVAWLGDEPLQPGRAYHVLHGHRWTKAKLARVNHRLNITTLEREDGAEIRPNDIGDITLTLQHALPVRPYADSRALGSLVLVDATSHQTCAALMVNAA